MIIFIFLQLIVACWTTILETTFLSINFFFYYKMFICFSLIGSTLSTKRTWLISYDVLCLEVVIAELEDRMQDTAVSRTPCIPSSLNRNCTVCSWLMLQRRFPFADRSILYAPSIDRLKYIFQYQYNFLHISRCPSTKFYYNQALSTAETMSPLILY